MAHDASFLARCEKFLLHPKVRALSLAQRVDFLENKGLSPEEITACLKSVERQNGLSRMLVSSPAEATAASSMSERVLGSSASASLWTLLRGYGLATAATLLLAYGYVRLRQRMVVQLLLAQRQAAVNKKQKRRLSVVETLRFVGDQRKQYEQLLMRVKSRVTRLQLLKSAQVSEEDAASRALQKQREAELRVLREQVTTLKTAVLDTYKTQMAQHAQLEARQVLEAEKDKATASETSSTSSAPSSEPLVEEAKPHPDLATPEELEDEKPAHPIAVA